MSSLEQKRSNFWYLLPIFLAIFGGIIAYVILRKSDPEKAKVCLLIGLGIMMLGIMINIYTSDSSTIPKDDSDFDWESEKLRIEQEKIARDEKAAVDRQITLAKQEESRTEQMKQLPDSCDGVSSINTDLYPTGEECLELIDERIFAYCLAENNNDEDKAWGCFGTVYALMDRNCKDSDEQGMLSVSYEVCFMSEMVFAYQNLIPNT